MHHHCAWAGETTNMDGWDAVREDLTGSTKQRLQGLESLLVSPQGGVGHRTFRGGRRGAVAMAMCAFKATHGANTITDLACVWRPPLLLLRPPPQAYLRQGGRLDREQLNDLVDMTGSLLADNNFKASSGDGGGHAALLGAHAHVCACAHSVLC